MSVMVLGEEGMMVNDFSQLGLSNSLCEIVHRIGWLMPTPIQSQAILPIIQGRDLLAIAWRRPEN